MIPQCLKSFISSSPVYTGMMGVAEGIRRASKGDLSNALLTTGGGLTLTYMGSATEEEFHQWGKVSIIGGTVAAALSGLGDVYQGIRKRNGRRVLTGAAQFAGGAAGALFTASLPPKVAVVATQALTLASMSAMLAYSGLKDIAKREYRKGIFKTTWGVMGVVFSGWCAFQELAQPSQMKGPTYRPLVAEAEQERNPPPKRELILATVYHNHGDSNRDAIAELVTENHRQYAKKWGVKHDVVTEDLVVGKCTDPDTHQAVDCSPQFNKLAYYMQQCANPPPKEVERWVNYADCDLPYTDPNVNPWLALDSLRGDDGDTSTVLVKEGVDWIDFYPLPGYQTHDPRVSINSGYMSARIDPKSCSWIKASWDHRNSPRDPASPNYLQCKTMGYCPDRRDVLNDQATIAMALQDRINNGVGLDGISIVLPRDPTSPHRAHLALNSMHRNGCVVSIGNYGEVYGPFEPGKLDPDDGKWRPGDWNGQPAGFPIMGRYPLPRDANGNCVDDPSLPIENVRLKKIDAMLAQIPKEQRFTLGMTHSPGEEHLTTQNHAKYAWMNRAEFRLMTDPIPLKCTLPTGEARSCAPPWRKVYEMERFVNEPEVPEVDHWYASGEEEGVYGNMNLSLSRVLKDLQGSTNASLLVANDPQHPSLANTGFMLVRRDSASREFLKKWMEMRNAPSRNPSDPNCPTLGICDSQEESFPEQEAFNRLLSEPELRKHVRVVEARSADRLYGVNTLGEKAERGDFFIRAPRMPKNGVLCDDPRGTSPPPMRKFYAEKMLRTMVEPAKYIPLYTETA